MHWWPAQVEKNLINFITTCIWDIILSIPLAQQLYVKSVDFGQQFLFATNTKLEK